MSALWDQVMRDSAGGILPGRNDLPRVLLEAAFAGRFDDDIPAFAAAIGDAWQMCEFPLLVLDHDDWAYLFREVGFVENGAPATLPSAIPALYRAAAEGHELGMSWTDDPKSALFFHDRNVKFGFRTVLLKLDPLEGSDRSEVLGRCHGKCSRDESEWVIDTRHLTQVPTAISPTQLREMDQ